uniref:B30.2/SPRY domain-containing protein n=1 Tax=Macrostomum lignano TaxID=282301 RepID=A0A1I8FHV0_9PLAT
ARIRWQLRTPGIPNDRSLNIFVKEDDCLTLHRQPVAQSTDCIRVPEATRAPAAPARVWQIHWSRKQRGTHAVVGVATANCPLHCVGYQSLVGSNPDSWGWDLGRNRALHDGRRTPYPATMCATLLGVAAQSALARRISSAGQLPACAECFIPAFSAVWGHCEITLRYLNGLEPEPLPLMVLCRSVIRKHFQRRAAAARRRPAAAASLMTFVDGCPTFHLDRWSRFAGGASFDWRRMARLLFGEDGLRVRLTVWRTMESDPVFAHSQRPLALQEVRKRTYLQCKRTI